MDRVNRPSNPGQVHPSVRAVRAEVCDDHRQEDLKRDRPLRGPQLKAKLRGGRDAELGEQRKSGDLDDRCEHTGSDDRVQQIEPKHAPARVPLRRVRHRSFEHQDQQHRAPDRQTAGDGRRVPLAHQRDGGADRQQQQQRVADVGDEALDDGLHGYRVSSNGVLVRCISYSVIVSLHATDRRGTGRGETGSKTPRRGPSFSTPEGTYSEAPIRGSVPPL